MAKYSHETRMAVVMAIASGGNIKGSARQYDVGRNLARKWYRAYVAGGVEQVLNTKRHYSRDFKLQAIEYRWQNKLYKQNAAQGNAEAGSNARSCGWSKHTKDKHRVGRL